MTLNSTCLNTNSSLPDIPTNISNLSVVPGHSDYDSNGKALSQRISSALARLTFSNSDIESLINEITDDGGKTWTTSTIVGLKPITSTIIYLSIALALFLVLSFTFCCMTCCRCCKKDSTQKYRRTKKRKCSGRCACMFVLILIGLIVAGQMIYICIQFNRTTNHLDESIVTINEEIYPKEISDYLKHIVSQFKQLDQYSTQNDSILIRASQVIFVNAFQDIFQEIYFFNDILQKAENSNLHIEEIGTIINQSNSTDIEQDLYKNIKEDNENLINQLQNPVTQLCDYADGNDGEINKIILDALGQVHQQLRKLIDTIENDILKNIISEENGMLINKSLEDQIRYYIYLVGIILLVLIILIGSIPIFFLFFTCLCGLCSRERDHTKSQSGSSNSCSKTGICCARIFCVPMFLILIIMVLLSGILYSVDLVTQGTCRTVHENRPFLISFLTDELFGANSSDLIIGQSNIKATVNTIIEDCGNQVHFTTHLLETHLSSLNNNTKEAMEKLNKQIFEQFNSSINHIDIQSNIERLQSLKNLTNTPDIENIIGQMESDLEYIQIRFDNITDHIPTIPVNLINSSIVQFRNYLNNVLNLTLDQCPLPLSTIYKTDTLVCHQLAASINGLWFSLFIYLFLITFGLCILGLCICDRSESKLSKTSISNMREPDSNIF